ncbi:MAG: polymer-forming cytoskeletal protein [Alphaproteobacteria bacterium]|jgi:cytoskeletal protein CcmA (bactofilin family)|nr:polymer-forming cytoskeletal protein [Alphaproteobacteria bacterium]MBU1278048.1 polymer-forming cytoskeletal protein [Alphaproteobacteria bacterium]MBU1572035.1 polymer-forming cytoskeletal protein [Alphaproteobacteria bacterium]MBU1828357.1 polymer-forming cytoskeletal protein [Alphaproteobacteria bacterium]MBU2078156.1 polymer-forming cytoskeletal protein [Alphaproteobacteria bacterium]
MESSKGDHHAQEGEQTMTTERHRSVLQEDLFIEGDIQGPGILEINGRLVGDIALDTVIVAANGSLQGGIVARNLTVIGTVCGQVAAKSLAIKAQAVVQSDKIATNVLSVEEGASVNGTIRMASGSNSIRPPA